MSKDFIRDMQGKRPALHSFLLPGQDGELPPINDAQTRILAEEITWCMKNGKLNVELSADMRGHLGAVVKPPFQTTKTGKGIIATFYLRHDVYEKYWGLK